MAKVKHARYGDRTSSESDKDGKSTRKFTGVWDVHLDSNDPDPISGFEVLRIPGVPIPGYSVYSPRPGFVVPFTICRSATPNPVQGSRRYWQVACTFEMIGSKEQKEQPQSADPFSLAPTVEPFVETTDHVMWYDYDGNEIVDVFGDLYAEPVRAPITLKGVTVNRYVSSYDEHTLGNWLNATNDDDWRGQPEDAWMIRSVKGQEVEFGTYTIGQLTFEILSHPVEFKVSMGGAAPKKHRTGWLAVRAARSNTFLDTEGDRVPFRREKAGSPVSMTWLDMDGHPSEEMLFHAFRTRPQKDFDEIA
ncbi:hypothetical protein [Neorhodopirellula pilleata]|uniref:Uncharacterized protein n=1 Tax=Neorhodopirellula pilleata TaxID=2714738 RepID=A0A5C5ZV46_9BACT|nr:hypothetical protein [Neorhodopirellula pilleata]TWT91385.1 hypothetical protein Pla100_52350 [Neorhodopirellula pilleata]TWT91434.1 hypothetical protein Pla100_52840 [Neorhodopirellula pilleata]